jgi:hypothetical protein
VFKSLLFLQKSKMCTQEKCAICDKLVKVYVCNNITRCDHLIIVVKFKLCSEHQNKASEISCPTLDKRNSTYSKTMWYA